MEVITVADAPPHTHGDSDPMPDVAEGNTALDTDDGSVPFPHGAPAHYRGDEELRVSNDGIECLTLLAVLATPFPPARSR